MRPLLLVGFVTFAVAILPSPAAASGRELTPLEGLPGVGILVEDITEGLGVSTESVETLVELSLRRSGIRVLTTEERYATTAAPYLYAQINLLPDGAQTIYVIELSVHQSALLANGKAVSGVLTWSATGRFGVVSNSRLKGAVRDTLEEMLDAFCNDFLKANPPQLPAPSKGKPVQKSKAASAAEL